MNKNEYYEKEYMPKMHKIGKLTGTLGVLLSFGPAIVLFAVYGLKPEPGPLLAAFVSAATAFGFLWVIEPISYFTVLGPIGTYMAFMSGNISNMRVPCASMAQVAAEVEPGTDEGSVISVIGMAVSVIINIFVLSIGVVLGSSLLAMMPPKVTEALNYLLPALFGALFIQFAMKSRNLAIVMVIIACLIYVAIGAGVFDFIPGAAGFLPTLLCVFGAIGISMATTKKKAEK